MQVSTRALLVAVAGCGVLAAGAVPAVAGSSLTPGIRITASSHKPRVSGDVVTGYNQGRLADATISGTVTGGHGDRVQLLAERFGSRSFTADGPPRAISRAGAYSFRVRPPLMTRYQVRLLSGAKVVGRSSTVTVYVEANVSQTGGGKCRRSPCVQTLHLTVQVPPSAYGREAGKRWFLYSALRLGPPGHTPPLPRFLTLDKHARAARPRRVRAGEFRVTLTFTFSIGSSSYRLAMNSCTRDSLAADGLGLPGHHGCGDKRIKRTIGYLG